MKRVEDVAKGKRLRGCRDERGISPKNQKAMQTRGSAPRKSWARWARYMAQDAAGVNGRGSMVFGGAFACWGSLLYMRRVTHLNSCWRFLLKLEQEQGAAHEVRKAQERWKKMS